MTAALTVMRAGLFDTVQDLGRIGYMALGMPTAGAMDRIGLTLANALAGNSANTAGLEIGVMGPDLRVEAESVRIALTGPLSPALIDGADTPPKPLESDRSHLLKRGQILRVGMVEGATIAYLAVAGGFAIAPFMGSLSTYARAGVGAVLTQHRTDPRLGPRAPELVRSGCTPQEAVDAAVSLLLPARPIDASLLETTA